MTQHVGFLRQKLDLRDSTSILCLLLRLPNEERSGSFDSNRGRGRSSNRGAMTWVAALAVRQQWFSYCRAKAD